MFFVISVSSRLNCDNIKTGLIMNHCKNRSESPLQHRTHAEEKNRGNTLQSMRIEAKFLHPNF